VADMIASRAMAKRPWSFTRPFPSIATAQS
jgi:hypothetical protein